MTPGRVPLSVLTLNLWNLNEPLELRMQRLERWLAEHRPDVVALQEVAAAEGATQAHRLAAAGDWQVHYQRATGDADRHQGLAVLTGPAAAGLPTVELPEVAGDEPRILQQVEVPVGAVRLRLANTHLAWRPADTAGRVRQAATVARGLADAAEPVLLVGDLNDVHDSPPLRELAGTGGLLDRCDDDQPTFAADNPWTWQPELLDRRVDHVLSDGGVTVTAVRRVLTGGDGPVVSDHHGVLARVGV